MNKDFNQFSKSPDIESKICSKCFTTLRDFVNSGFVGCPNCYNAFSEQIDEYIALTQYGKQHAGKLYLKNELSLEQKLANYQRELRQAILEERFEDCVSIKQKISALKENLS